MFSKRKNHEADKGDLKHKYPKPRIAWIGYDREIGN